MKARKTWILVANSCEAHLYTSPRAKLLTPNKKNNVLVLVGDFYHPESREKDSELVTDRLGRWGRSGGRLSHGTFAEPTQPKAHEQEVFAQQLGEILENGRTANQFEDLIIVAAPKFQGKLKQKMNDKLNTLVSANIIKDYTKDTPQQLAGHLAAHL